ncbi:MAG TPA: aspartyl protease family protein [Candidatus Eisenbacteria bacterium]|nr:aspartyl protease family protein [Candidatus Eisenbacteria bacterium]
MSPKFRRLSPALALALIATLPPAAHAAADAGARAVIDRYAQAAGPAAHTVRTKGTLHAFGLTGTVESFSQSPDKAASVTALGPFTLREGVDGAHGWKTDPGGKLLALDGKDLDEARANAWFDNEAWRLPDEGGGTVKSLPDVRDSAGSYHALEVTPPVGRPRTLYFEAATGLLAREEGHVDQQVVVTTLSQYREIQGHKIPGTTHTELVGLPQNALTMTLDSAWVDVPVEPSRFAEPSAQQAEAVKWLKTPGRAALPFDYRGKHLWLRASVNGGPPADFIFDTGASITVIDSSYAAKIGLETQGHQQGQGAGATGGASFSKLRSLRVTGVGDSDDGIELGETRVAVLSVNPVLAPFFWRDAAGVIGFDVIDQFVDEIDYDHRTLVLHDPKTFKYEGKGEAIPMRLANHVPVVTMTLDGRYTGDFRLDVGSSSTVDLHTPFVKAHQLAAHAGKSVEIEGGGFGGTFSNRLVRMQSLQVGRFAWRRPLVTLTQATSGAFTSEDYAGNVGNRVLERFKVTFDYDGRKVYLEPGAKYAAADHFARGGLQLALENDQVIAMGVLAGSAADAAGLREGDQVVSIDGKPIRTWNPDTIEDALNEGPVGATHKIQYRRDGKLAVTTVKLKDML